MYLPDLPAPSRATADPPNLPPGPPPTASFTDARGRTWTIILDAQVIAELRAGFGIDLERIAHTPAGWGYLELAALVVNEERFRPVLWAVCARQAAVIGLASGDFAAAVGGFETFSGKPRPLVGATPADDPLGYAGGAFISAVRRHWPASPLADAIVSPADL